MSLSLRIQTIPSRDNQVCRWGRHVLHYSRVWALTRNRHTQTRNLNLGAHIHGNLETRRQGSLCRGFVYDALLQPNGFGTHRNGVIDHATGIGRIASREGGMDRYRIRHSGRSITNYGSAKKRGARWQWCCAMKREHRNSRRVKTLSSTYRKMSTISMGTGTSASVAYTV